jgi:hypothetical protein
MSRESVRAAFSYLLVNDGTLTRRAATLRRMILGFPLSSCSQTRRTFHPIARKALATRLSRLIFPEIFALQKSTLVAGTDRQRRHPCQKHPSTNTANFTPRNTRSGLPGNPESWPICQPRTPDRINNDRNFHSVERVPRAFTRLIRNAFQQFERKCRDAIGSTNHPNNDLELVRHLSKKNLLVRPKGERPRTSSPR